MGIGGLLRGNYFKDMTVAYQPFIAFANESRWVQIRDGNVFALSIFERHYSKRHYKDGRIVTRFVGPGQRIVLMTTDGNALFVWRKFISMDDQVGVNCSVFRNEGNLLSSALILDAEKFAVQRWPAETRFFTYVDEKKIKSSNPGYCFILAGWRRVGRTKKRGLIILEKILK